MPSRCICFFEEYTKAANVQKQFSITLGRPCMREAFGPRHSPSRYKESNRAINVCASQEEREKKSAPIIISTRDRYFLIIQGVIVAKRRELAHEG